jgi:hypothetical protein
MPAELVGDLCPQCGCLLEPVADLAELVGSRSINRRDEPDNALFAPSHEAIATRLDEFIARRAERLERKRALLADAHGLDGDDPPADAIALPDPHAE